VGYLGRVFRQGEPFVIPARFRGEGGDDPLLVAVIRAPHCHGRAEKWLVQHQLLGANWAAREPTVYVRVVSPVGDPVPSEAFQARVQRPTEWVRAPHRSPPAGRSSSRSAASGMLMCRGAFAAYVRRAEFPRGAGSGSSGSPLLELLLERVRREHAGRPGRRELRARVIVRRAKGWMRRGLVACRAESARSWAISRSISALLMAVTRPDWSTIVISQSG
jgi:hypothetical protein